MLWLVKLKKQKNDTYANKAEAKIAAEAMDNARSAARAILRRTEEFIEIFSELKTPFRDSVDDLETIVNEGTDYQEHTKKEQHIVITSMSLAKTISNLLEAPIIDENGLV